MKLGFQGLLVLIAACGTEGAMMQATWQRDSVESSLSLPAHAVWCRDLGFLEVVGGRNDTGIALAVFPGDSLRGGQYTVLPPAGRTDDRGIAAVAVRLFSQDELLAFEGLTGEARIDSQPDGLAGFFNARLRTPLGGDSLLVEAHFSAVQITDGGVECRPEAAPDSAGSDSTSADSAAADSAAVLD